MGSKHSSFRTMPIATEDQATVITSDKMPCNSLNISRLVASRRRCVQKKLKGKRNVSATFNINEFESAYDSQESNVQSCVSSMSSNQNVFSSTSSVGNEPSLTTTTSVFIANPVGINRTDFDKDSLMLDINSATEEGLMTLPGITRQTSRNIVSYRRLIGGFKNIQDIALVSGVGASLYVRFRSEITCHDCQPKIIQEQQQIQTDANDKISKSFTFSSHSSASSSGIDIAPINEEDYNLLHHDNIRNSCVDDDHDSKQIKKCC